MLKNIKHQFKISNIIIVILAIEIISYAGSVFNLVNLFGFGVIVAVVLLLALWRLEFGLLILMAELFIGSKGYLFYWSVGNVEISVRLAMFAVVFVAYLFNVWRTKKIYFWQWSLAQPYLVLAAVLVMGLVVGVLHQNGATNIFFDGNGYLFLGLILPLTQALQRSQQIEWFFKVLIAAVVASSIKTLILLFLFSHSSAWPYVLPGLYTWVRDTGVGEVTQFNNGFVRVFFQSHFYQVVVFFIAVAYWWVPSAAALWRQKYLSQPVVLTALTGLIVFISYSRSFWTGVFAALGMLIIFVLSTKIVHWQRLTRLIISLAILMLINYGIVYGLVNVRWPFADSGPRVNATNLIRERANVTTEPAAETRWKSLPVLVAEIQKSPIWGFGFGKTLTYQSSDPRVLAERPNGQYTTYAFEWGYLDLLLKMGLVGLIAYGWLIWRLAKICWQKVLGKDKQSLPAAAMTLGIFAGLAALLAINMFTPYLNHPLGIGWLLLVSVYLYPPYALHNNKIA